MDLVFSDAFGTGDLIVVEKVPLTPYIVLIYPKSAIARLIVLTPKVFLWIPLLQQQFY